MLVTNDKLHSLIDKGVVNALHENVNGSSIDIRLGDTIKIYRSNFSVLDPARKIFPPVDSVKIPDNGLTITFGQFFLAESIEVFNLPLNISAEFKLKSSIARAGLNHLLAGWCDPGWYNSKLTMEFQLVAPVQFVLRSGMRIGQMIFFEHKHIDESKSYKTNGRYNNNLVVTESKGV